MRLTILRCYSRQKSRIEANDGVCPFETSSSHTGVLTRAKLEEMRWETLEHPPYSFDFSPCNYFLFAPLKESLGDKKFQSNEEVEEYVRN